MRIRIDKLTRDDNALLWEGKPFTGIGYDVREGGEIHGLFNIAAGKIIGPHSDWSEGKRRFDFDAVHWSEELETLLVDGEPFKGVLYSFEPTGEMYEEIEHTDGESIRVTNKHWYPSGAPKVISVGNDNCSWYENGQPQSVRSTDAMVVFDQSGRIHTIDLEPEFRGQLFDRFSPIVSDDLTLVGAVDDQLVCQLVGLEKLTMLGIERSSLTWKGLNAFIGCSRLRELRIGENEKFTRTEAAELAAQLPSCKLVDLDEAEAFAAAHDPQPEQ